MKSAAIYARVSSDKQREENTIASQTAALVAFAREQQFDVPQEWVFEDDGYSGAELIRPGLERVRDLADNGGKQTRRSSEPSPGRRRRPRRREKVAGTLGAIVGTEDCHAGECP